VEVDADAGNVFCSGCLDFLFAIGNNSTSTESIERITAASFAGFLTDVGTTPSRTCFLDQGTFPGNAPVSADRSSGSGGIVGFNYSIGAGISPGSCGPVLIIETNATSFTAGTLSLIDSGVAQVSSFAPVPGPIVGAGLPGLIISCGGLITLARRRRFRLAA
jgi:hypothetical protein